jgi:hypothetical protein
MRRGRGRVEGGVGWERAGGGVGGGDGSGVRAWGGQGKGGEGQGGVGGVLRAGQARTSSSFKCLYMRSRPHLPLLTTTSLFFTASSTANIAQHLGSLSSFMRFHVCEEVGWRVRGVGGCGRGVRGM